MQRRNPFTPQYIYDKHRKKTFALILVVALTPLIFFQLTTNVDATITTTWGTITFDDGANANTQHYNQKIQLAPTTATTDSTTDDFYAGNNLVDLFAMTALREGGGVEINQGYIYQTGSTPALAGNTVYHTFLDNNLIYVSTHGGGLSVINTQGTEDPGDDTLVTRYHTGSTPALTHNLVRHTFLNNNLLHISTHAGLSVIDTKGTIDPGDDTLVTRYHTGSTPPLLDNRLHHASLVDNLLYISSDYHGGLVVIDTKGTVDPGDDTLEGSYTTTSSPISFLSGGSWPNAVNSSFYDSLEGFLYISHYQSGLYVVDTKKTATSSDDTLVTRYHTGSTPALAHNNVYHTFLDNNLLYVSTWGGGLSVINTNGTATSSDDTLVTRYHTGSTVALANNDVTHIFLANNLLHVSNYGGGLSIINTEGTIDPNDDTLVTRYHTGSTPALAGNTVYHTFLDNNLLYVSTYGGGLSVIDTTGTYRPSGQYHSFAQNIAGIGTTTITMDSTITSDQDIDLSYRTGAAEAAWRDDFASTSSYAGDLYAWGEEFQTATVTDGVLRLSDPAPDGSWGAVWFDTGKPDDFFAAGSVVTARIRVNNTDTDREFNDWLFLDDWEGDSTFYDEVNEWITVTYTADTAFSDVGFEPWFVDGLDWNLGDYWEIDWIQITTPDSMGEWGAWQTCSGSTCILPDISASTWLQYKLDLTTTDTSSSPIVNSVSYNGDYNSTGTYTSDTTTFNKTQDLITFDAVTNTPAGTDINFEYSTNNGKTWNTIIPGQNLTNDNITASNFTWRASLLTTDGAYTPTITSVTLTTSKHNPQSGSSAKTQVANLEAQGKMEEAQSIRDKYPHLFTDNAKPEDVQKKIIELLTETVSLLEKLKEKEGE